MAISKHRKGQAKKVQEVYALLVASRLSEGQSRTGFAPQRKWKKTPYTNPERATRSTKGSRKKAAARQRRSNATV
jgi:hypothetical protein